MMFYKVMVYFLSTFEWAYSYEESLLVKYVKHFEAEGFFFGGGRGLTLTLRYWVSQGTEILTTK